MESAHRFSGTVEIFPQKGGWHYVAVPLAISEPLLPVAERGLIAVEATVGTSTWPTSLLPKGGGTHFLALGAKVRRSENLELGDEVQVSFTLRAR